MKRADKRLKNPNMAFRQLLGGISGGSCSPQSGRCLGCLSDGGRYELGSRVNDGLKSVCLLLDQTPSSPRHSRSSVRSKAGKSHENASCYSLIAAAGLIVVKHDISQAFITGISCAILALLFLVQWFGTSRVGGLFAPVVIIWLAVNLLFGIYVSFAGS